MKRLLLLSGALLVLGASAASAAPGLNLAWGSGCWLENPVNAKTFACNTNTGNAQMTGSYTPTASQPAFVGVECVLDFQVDGVTVPDWWTFFEAGTCRQTSLSTSADFSGAPQTSCTDQWFGLGAGGIAAYQTAASPIHDERVNTPGWARLKVAYALADPSPLTGGTEYYGFRATMNYAKTVGSPSCAGCTTPVTIVLNEIKSAENTGPFERVTDQDINRCLTWGASTVACAAVPARNTSWGQVKSLYR